MIGLFSPVLLPSVSMTRFQSCHQEQFVSLFLLHYFPISLMMKILVAQWIMPLQRISEGPSCKAECLATRGHCPAAGFCDRCSVLHLHALTWTFACAESVGWGLQVTRIESNKAANHPTNPCPAPAPPCPGHKNPDLAFPCCLDILHINHSATLPRILIPSLILIAFML